MKEPVFKKNQPLHGVEPVKSMAYVRAAMVLTVVLIFALVGYMFFTFQSDIGVDLATEDTLKAKSSPLLVELWENRRAHPSRKFVALSSLSIPCVKSEASLQTSS